MKLKFFLPVILGLAVVACSNAPPKPKPVAVAKPSTIRLTLLPQETPRVGKPVTVLAKLNYVQERVVVTPDQLETVHTQKFHLLLVDSTLSDYQHLHPQPTNTPGIYSFTFTPKVPGGYRAWADITPVGGSEEFAMSEELGADRLGKINKTESHTATMNGYHFALSFDKPPVEGGESVGTILVTDSKGNPVTVLEPVMGAYAHIAGFYDDFRTVAHMHPMGAEPKGEHDRGGPDLQFHFAPTKTGFVKMFAQVKVAGKEMMVPFGVNVGK